MNHDARKLAEKVRAMSTADREIALQAIEEPLRAAVLFHVLDHEAKVAGLVEHVLRGADKQIRADRLAKVPEAVREQVRATVIERFKRADMPAEGEKK